MNHYLGGGGGEVMFISNFLFGEGVDVEFPGGGSYVTSI